MLTHLMQCNKPLQLKAVRVHEIIHSVPWTPPRISKSEELFYEGITERDAFGWVGPQEVALRTPAKRRRRS